MLDLDACEIRLVNQVDGSVLSRVAELEMDNFGAGGLNLWHLPAFARHGRLYVVEEAGKVIAAAELMRLWDDPGSAYLFGLCVQRDKQGQGIGKLLLGEILRKAALDQVSVIGLTVAEENQQAVSLYLSLGFQITGFLKDEYGPGQDRLAMEWRETR